MDDFHHDSGSGQTYGRGRRLNQQWTLGCVAVFLFFFLFVAAIFYKVLRRVDPDHSQRAPAPRSSEDVDPWSDAGAATSQPRRQPPVGTARRFSAPADR